MDKVNLNGFHLNFTSTNGLECICAGFALVQFGSVAEFALLHHTFPVIQRCNLKLSSKPQNLMKPKTWYFNQGDFEFFC